MLRTITIPKYYLKIIRHLNSLLFPGIIQIETKFFALFIDSLSHDHREFFRHCSIYISLSQNLYQQLLQVAFFKHTSDIPGISAFISMMRNYSILFPVWMLNFFAMLFRIFCIKFYRYLLFPEVIYQSVPEEAARSWKQTGHWHHSAL